MTYAQFIGFFASFTANNEIWIYDDYSYRGPMERALYQISQSMSLRWFSDIAVYSHCNDHHTISAFIADKLGLTRTD